jgi:hypothetical protein
MGITRIRVERSHQLADGRPWALARTPFPVVDACRDGRGEDDGHRERPRFTQPKSRTGCEIEADDRDGSGRGRAMCFTTAFHRASRSEHRAVAVVSRDLAQWLPHPPAVGKLSGEEREDLLRQLLVLLDGAAEDPQLGNLVEITRDQRCARLIPAEIEGWKHDLPGSGSSVTRTTWRSGHCSATSERKAAPNRARYSGTLCRYLTSMLRTLWSGPSLIAASAGFHTRKSGRNSLMPVFSIC